MPTPYISYFIMGATVLISFATFNRPQLLQSLQFNAYFISHHKQWYRALSHAFVHANLPHLAVNMLVFFFFGRNVELLFFQLFGNKAFLFFPLLYVGGIAFSTLPSFKKHANNPHYNAVGASGAVAAVLFAHILMLPTRAVYLFLLPIPIPSFIFGALYLMYERYMEKKTEDNVAHDAHFWGAIFGFGFWGAIFGFGFTVILKWELLFSFFRKILDFITQWI